MFPEGGCLVLHTGRRGSDPSDGERRGRPGRAGEERGASGDGGVVAGQRRGQSKIKRINLL
jgi:hypothetical protein